MPCSIEHDEQFYYIMFNFLTHASSFRQILPHLCFCQETNSLKQGILKGIVSHLLDFLGRIIINFQHGKFILSLMIEFNLALQVVNIRKYRYLFKLAFFEEPSHLSGIKALFVYGLYHSIHPQGSKFKTNQCHKIRLQIFDVWCKNVRQMC